MRRLVDVAKFLSENLPEYESTISSCALHVVILPPLYGANFSESDWAINWKHSRFPAIVKLSFCSPFYAI